jgi:VanZ family protein
MTFFGEENFWLYAPLIIWIGGIFYLSSNKGSMSRTSPYFVPVLHFLLPGAGEKPLKRYHFVVRKLCHFFGYAMLALLAAIVFYNSSLIAAARFWHICAFALVLIIAAADEIRQSFSPERVGSLSDVALDCAGGLTAIFLFWLFSARG